MTTPNNAITVSDYMRQPQQMARFTDILGDQNAAAYVQSVLIVVASDEKLRDCSPQSVYKSALRAASLGLSCDPSLKQAWIVPYNKKQRDGTWIKEAQFQPHYKGLYTLAMRTGKYWTINVAPVYEGQRVMENPLTGMHAVKDGNSIGMPDSYNNAYSQDVTVRRRKDMKIIGWIGYFKTKKGAEKSVWMSCAEIDDHARKYVKDYDKNPNWNDAEKRPVMEMKTVLRQLLSWADLSGTENAALVEAIQSDELPIDVKSEEVHTEPQTTTPAGMTVEQARETVVKTSGGERFIGEMTVDELNLVIEKSILPNSIEAAKIVLLADFNMEPAKPQPKTEQQNMKELGF